MKKNVLIGAFLMYLTVFVLIAVFSVSSCSSEEDQLIGKWQRYDDYAEGTVIEVKRMNDNTLQGWLVTVSNEMQNNGFVVGDIKWIEITSKRLNYYESKDLVKKIDPKTGQVAGTDYEKIQMELVATDLLSLRPVASTGTGYRQKWKRLQTE
ncbi:MAG: hypothetical protein ACPGXL_03250 [Chitinophagales bacterium]